MGWLKKLLKADVGDTQRAIMDALCLSLCADGVVAAVEIDESVGYIVGMMGVSTQQAASLLGESLERVGRDPQGMLNGLPGLVPHAEDRQAVLFAAAFIQYVDGKITPEEDALLSSMAELLEVSSAGVADIIAQVEAQLARLSPS